MHGRRAGAGRQRVAPFALAHALDGRVGRQHDGLETGRLGPLHQRVVEAAIGLPIKLKPQRPAPRLGQHGLGDAFHRHIGLGAEHVARALRRGGQRAGPFPIGVRQLLMRHRRQQDRVRQFAAGQRHARVAASQRTQNARPQAQALPGGDVFAQCDLVRRAALKKGPRRIVQRVPGGLGVVAKRCWSWGGRFQN